MTSELWWPLVIVLVIVLALSCLLLFLVLSHLHNRTARRAMEERLAELKRMEREPQSGMWIKCPHHGDLPLTQAVFEKQTRQEAYRCPMCGHIPRKIWRKA